ncbi:hypothetical protein KDAU_05020 [Dictyobacter aurantiacus]|uniref:Uncharacterized protein n=1 Tax=Dictyobacter aurantiacus TaxID=1936993 RepID=A0A401Z8L0_9CHLR|nr:hypothetical protein KDAU_05020 [Dictyobacter aurantiacus]
MKSAIDLSRFGTQDQKVRFTTPPLLVLPPLEELEELEVLVELVELPPPQAASRNESKSKTLIPVNAFLRRR